MATAYAELHCHTQFSMLDGASAPHELVERAAALGMEALAVTDHQGLYGAVRFATAAEAAGIRPIIGVEIELLDAVVPDPDGIVVPAKRPVRGSGRAPAEAAPIAREGVPARPRPRRARLPGHRAFVKEDLRGIGEAQRGPHLVLLARNTDGYRSLARLVSRANLAGTKAVPRFDHALLEAHTEGLVALSGCRHGEIARRLRAGDREGARAVAETYARWFGSGAGGSPSSAGFFVELEHHLLPDDDWLVAESARLAAELGLPVVVTNDVHYAHREGRELQDVLTAIRHGRSLDTLADLRRPDGESYLKSGDELIELAPPDLRDAWAEGIANSVELARSCSVDLGFERYRFPGFPVPKGETAFSYLAQLCQDGARARYHPLTSAVLKQLAHELDVIEKTGLAEFFLICWDLMRFARERGIPAQGRGSAADSIVAYVLGITRVDPIRHRLLFERFINEGRTTYPDVDIDFSNARREEVIQYVYGRYGPEHTGMVCNLVTYRARSAVREVGAALGFPRPLVDRVAKALETYDSVMVRRDLEAEGGFAQFFARPGEAGDLAPDPARAQGLTDEMGQLNHGRGGRFRPDAGERTGRLVRKGDEEPPGATAGQRPAPPVLGGPERPDRGDTPSPTAFAGEWQESDASRLFPTDPGGRRQRPPALPDAPAPGTALRGGPLRQPPGSSLSATPLLVSDGAAPSGLDSPPLSTEVADEGSNGGSAPLTSHPIAESKERRPLDDRLAPRTAIRGGGLSDDKGGPGDSPVSVRWLRDLERGGRPSGNRGGGDRPHVRPGEIPLAERPTTANAGFEHSWVASGQAATVADALLPPPTVDGRRIDPESGMFEPEDRRSDPAPRSSVARIEPEAAPERHLGSTVGLSDWERWLEFCARLDGFPRHLSIHSGGMLITAAPLIDIAPLERATMPDRVVVQYDKRDVETIKLIKLDLLGLGMLAAIDEALMLIQRDCAVCLDLDRLPEEIPEVFEMLQAADTVGVFQVESRAQMQTLPKSRPTCLDDLVVEVAIIRPGPIQGNAVHPYLRRKQGLEPVTYLHPKLEPILGETLGVILYQEQVMEIAIQVGGFTPAESDGFRRAMGTWRSTKEMEKLHRQFSDGCIANGMTPEDAEELFRRVSAFASFGFAKSHAAAFARTAYESSFLKLFYPAHLTVGLINAQPMGFYPVEVLINDAKRHGVAILPVDVSASGYHTTTEWVGMPGWALPEGAEEEPLPPGSGIDRRPDPVRSPACVMPSLQARQRWAADSAVGFGIRLGLHLVKGIGEEHEELLDLELARGPYTSLADVVTRTGLPEEVIERLIRVGALDSLGTPRRELLWQLREVTGAARGRVDGKPTRGAAKGSKRAAGRPMDLQLPATDAPALPALTERERLGDSYAVISLDSRKQVIELFRPALDALGAIPNSELAARRPGPVRLGGLVVTRQHPMTARGTVFLALEDETGMVNVTLWPTVWAEFRNTVRRHALLLVDGELQREGNVVNVVARNVRSLVEAAAPHGGPERPPGVRQLGYAGMRRVG
jgi:DNA polymerase III alpha subunit